MISSKIRITSVRLRPSSEADGYLWSGNAVLTSACKSVRVDIIRDYRENRVQWRSLTPRFPVNTCGCGTDVSISSERGPEASAHCWFDPVNVAPFLCLSGGRRHNWAGLTAGFVRAEFGPSICLAAAQVCAEAGIRLHWHTRGWSAIQLHDTCGSNKDLKSAG